MLKIDRVVKLKTELYNLDDDKVTLMSENFCLIITDEDSILSIMADASKGCKRFEVTFKSGKVESIKGVEE